MHGIDTTQTPKSSFFSISSAAVHAIETSLPVAMMVRAFSIDDSRIMYAPFETPSVFLTSVITGVSCRVRSIALGPSCMTAISHADEVSFASAGLNTSRFGIARKEAACSIGWCVGPSSPTATES